MKNSLKPRQVTLLGLLSGLLILMSVTPLGYLRIGPLSATLNMIPVGIAAIALGPLGGAVTGCVFGLTSFFSALTGGSPMGTMLISISPVRYFVLAFLPRFLMGISVGLVWKLLSGRCPDPARYLVGFLSAFLNTVLFMGGLVLLFGETEYVQSLIGGQNVLLFIVTFVGVNAVFEMACATILVAALGKAIYKAHLVGR